MSVTAVQLFSLPVSDQDRARDFSADVLGVELVDDAEPGSVRGTVLEKGDLDGDAAGLAALGVELPGGLQEAPWGRWVELTDPDGNGIVLQATAPAPAA